MLNLLGTEFVLGPPSQKGPNPLHNFETNENGVASAQEGNGVKEVWETICEFRAKMAEDGGLREKRRRQGK